MARKSAFVIELSGEERAELERRVACYTLPHKVVVRARMILYAADGLPDTEIAAGSNGARRSSAAGGADSSSSGSRARGCKRGGPPASFSPRSRWPR